MKFALLGFDDSISTLVRALISEQVPIVGLFGMSTAQSDELGAICPLAEVRPDWNDALALERDVIVIAGREMLAEDRIEPLRKLIQVGQPLVLSHPIVDSMVDCFELEMIRVDGGGLLLPWVATAKHPACQRIKSLANEHAWGNLEQIIIERGVREQEPRTVLRMFIRDMHLVRGWIGDLTKVAALAGSPTNYGSLGVQLTGPHGTLVRWTNQASPNNSTARITFVGSQGKGVLTLGDSTSVWSYESDGSESERIEPANEAQALFEQLQKLSTDAAAPPTWLDACRELELADAVERSIAKGRTIELYLEEVGEHYTFKGVMAAGGCGLLLLAIFLVIVATTLTNLGVPLVGAWPYLLLGVLAAFLLLQTLRLAFPPEPRSGR